MAGKTSTYYNFSKQRIIDWLLDGDVSIKYQVYRDLLDTEKPDLRRQIANEGWGDLYMSYRNDDGHWGNGFYNPKWTCSHYTLLDLKNLDIHPDNEIIRETIKIILKNEKGKDGGINPSKTIKNSDVCINGMFLNYACYFKTPQHDLETIVDFLISVQMNDGGFNCQSNRKGAIHSSLHSTISVLEGFHEYENNDYKHRIEEIKKIETEAQEFILQHRLYKSDHTGEIIDKRMLLLSSPSRWRYDVLRALDYFQESNLPFDPRMQDALDVLISKRRKDGKWPLQGVHKGETHFEMEDTREPSRWNTLRALRVLKHFRE